MATQFEAAGVVFTESSFGGYVECMDCGGLCAAEGNPYGVDPRDHTCAV